MKKDADLPSRCYRLPSGSVRYMPRGGKPEVIGTKNTPLHEVWKRWQALQEAPSDLTVASEDWYQSHNFLALSPRTQSDYRDWCATRPIKAFKGWSLPQIEPSDINQYLQARGKESIRRANLELTWLRLVLRHAVSIGMIRENPAREIAPLKDTNKQPRRYVSDADYQAMYAAATEPVQVAMEVSYCTGLRQGDVLSLRWDQIQETIEVTESKTGRKYRKRISERLQRALDAARTLPGHRFGGWVVRTKAGQRYTASGFQANWQRAKRRIPEAQRFVYHEIRHKAITDAKGDKQAFSMHADARMLGVYDHETIISDSH